MNLINFNQIGGFPLTTDTLGKLQTAFSLFNALGAIAGDKSIISGCTLVGSNVSDGVVYVNGEVFDFKGGLLQTNVIIKEDTESLIFGNSNAYPVIKKRYIQFGIGVGQMAWSGFKSIDPTTALTTRMAELEKKTAVFQTGGGMVLWNKPAVDIPTGWAEVIDWRGRMPVGFKTGDADFGDWDNRNGGSKTKTLTEAELPVINKTIDSNTAIDFGSGSGVAQRAASVSAGTGAPIKTQIQFGGGESFSILNPYRVVIFIEYVG